MYKLFFGNVEPYYEEKAFNEGYAKVCTYRKNKIDKLKIQADKARSLTAGLLFEEACKSFGLEMLLGRLEDDEHGKPYFNCSDEMFPGGKKMYFNISHSENYVMVGISDGPIGVDIQFMKEIKQDIASRFFHQEEQDMYYKAPDDQYMETFFRIWCLKESYVKYIGTGLSEGLNTFSVINHMQDCGIWKDDYVYAVTTCDYKAIDEAEKLEAEKKAEEALGDIKSAIKEAINEAKDEAKEVAKVGKLVGKVVSSSVIKKAEEVATETKKKLEPVKTTVIKPGETLEEAINATKKEAPKTFDAVMSAVKTVGQEVVKAASVVKEEVNKVMDSVKAEATKVSDAVKEDIEDNAKHDASIQKVPDKKVTLYQQVVASEDEEQIAYRAARAKHTMQMRRNTKYFRMK